MSESQERWRAFEKLVAEIHRALDRSNSYDIAVDRKLRDDHDGEYQIDVVLRPKDGLHGPILVSCKAWKDRVGVAHVREWASVVANLGGSAGIIVAEHGFTKEAIQEAKPSARRLSLWTPRPLNLDDYGPDKNSQNGYIASVGFEMRLMEPRLKTDTFRLDVERVTKGEPVNVSFSFSKDTREKWYLMNQKSEVVGNAWDMFEEIATAAKETGTIKIAPGPGHFVIIDGTKFQFNGVSMDLEMVEHRRTSRVNMLDYAIAYENAVTGQVRTVPLPPSVLQLPSK